MSHLSDVQSLAQYVDNEEDIRQKCNFVKVLINEKREFLTQEELDQIWKTTQEKYSK